MVTQEQDGILHGKNIKMMPDKSINITNGKYTVCDAEHPHYYLHLTAAKVMTKPSQKTVFGNNLLDKRFELSRCHGLVAVVNGLA